jgi:hypothetical protein
LIFQGGYVDEVLKSFKAQMYDRVSSPLTFSFVLSWCAWNYRFLLLLIGTSSASEKFAYVDQHLFTAWQDYAFRGFLFPLCSALFYIYLYPTPARKVYEFTQSEAVKMKKAQQRIEDKTPISEEEAAELRANMRKEKRERADELERAEKIITQLTTDLARFETKPSVADTLHITTTHQADPPDLVLTQGQMELLKSIANHRADFIAEDYFDSNLDVTLARRRDNVDTLAASRLITTRYDPNGQRVLSTTPSGNRIVAAEPVAAQTA